MIGYMFVLMCICMFTKNCCGIQTTRKNIHNLQAYFKLTQEYCELTLGQHREVSKEREG